MSKKNPDGRISFGQYRLFDLGIFLVIMLGCEVLNIFAIKSWFKGELFTVSVMMLISLLVLVRWNFFGIIFPIADGLVYCLLLKAPAESYLIYIIGNAFIVLAWFVLKLFGKEKVKKWYRLLLYVASGYLLVVAGRALVALCCGYSFYGYFVNFLGLGELFNFVFTYGVMLLLVRLNGLFCDQKTYLKEEAYKRDHPHPADEAKWFGYTELNEEDLRALTQMDAFDRALAGRRKRGQAPKPQPSDDEKLLAALEECKTEIVDRQKITPEEEGEIPQTDVEGAEEFGADKADSFCDDEEELDDLTKLDG